MTITPEQGQHIAALMADIRAALDLPTWDRPGCLAAVAKCRDTSLPNLAMAAIRLAANPNAHTPGALSVRDGEHWREKVATVHRFPPRRDESCPRHPGEWPDNCRGCASDKLAGTESDAGNQRASVEPHDRVGVLRHLHQVAVSSLCSHGVTFEHCLQDHDTEGEAG